MTLVSGGGKIRKFRARRHMRLRRDGTVAPDGDIFRNVRKIADPGFLADDRVMQGAAVDRCIGANLNPILNDDTA